MYRRSEKIVYRARRIFGGSSASEFFNSYSRYHQLRPWPRCWGWVLGIAISLQPTHRFRIGDGTATMFSDSQE